MNNTPYLYKFESKEGVKILNICRATLVQYVKTGTIRAVRLPNVMYRYNDDDM